MEKFDDIRGHGSLFFFPILFFHHDFAFLGIRLVVVVGVVLVELHEGGLLGGRSHEVNKLGQVLDNEILGVVAFEHKARDHDDNGQQGADGDQGVVAEGTGLAGDEVA